MADTNDESNLILVRLTKKFADRIYHEFDNEHPHKTAHGGELLVTGGVASDDPKKDTRRVAKAARTPGVLGAIMQGVLEEVRDPKVVATPDPVDILDVVNGVVTPGYPAAAAADAGAASADATADATAEADAATPAATGKGKDSSSSK
jgi:hypothetical protein